MNRAEARAAGVWQTCEHPRTPENTAKVSKACPAGRCRICLRRQKLRYRVRCAGTRARRDATYRYNRTEKCRAVNLRYEKRKQELMNPATEKGHVLDAKRIVVLSDIQIPFQDDAALGLALRFVASFKPDAVILNGDIVDMYALSDFDHDPDSKGRRLSTEISGAAALMARLSRVKQKVWLGGNHEDRWRRVIWRTRAGKDDIAQLVSALLDGATEADAFTRVFGLAEHGFMYWPYGHYILLANGNLVVTHGFSVSKHSAYSAKAHAERLRRSVLIGHTHRLGAHYATAIGEPLGAFENGCLCRLDPEYVQFPNWQQGFSLVTVDDDNYHVEQIPILPGYRIQYGGKTYEERSAEAEQEARLMQPATPGQTLGHALVPDVR